MSSPNSDKPTASTTTINASEDLAAYLVSVADKLQSRMDEVSDNMNKKIEEMSKRIDTLEKSLKQPTTAAATQENE